MHVSRCPVFRLWRTSPLSSICTWRASPFNALHGEHLEFMNGEIRLCRPKLPTVLTIACTADHFSPVSPCTSMPWRRRTAASRAVKRKRKAKEKSDGRAASRAAAGRGELQATDGLQAELQAEKSEREKRKKAASRAAKLKRSRSYTTANANAKLYDPELYDPDWFSVYIHRTCTRCLRTMGEMFYCREPRSECSLRHMFNAAFWLYHQQQMGWIEIIPRDESTADGPDDVASNTILRAASASISES